MACLWVPTFWLPLQPRPGQRLNKASQEASRICQTWPALAPSETQQNSESIFTEAGSKRGQCFQCAPCEVRPTSRPADITDARQCMYLNTHMYVHIHAHTYMCTKIHVHMYETYIYICMYIYIYVYVYIYVYIYIYAPTLRHTHACMQASANARRRIPVCMQSLCLQLACFFLHLRAVSAEKAMIHVSAFIYTVYICIYRYMYAHSCTSAGSAHIL